MLHLLARSADATVLWFECARLMAETQNVMAMRVMGMGGAWVVAQDEGRAMMIEKAPAFTEAMMAGALSAMGGARPEAIGRAVLAPLSDTVRMNHQRLLENGPRAMQFPHSQDMTE